MKKIKICHVVTRFDIGGLENGVANLCNHYDRSRFEPMICCLKGTGPMIERLKPDVRVLCLNIPEGKSIFRFLTMALFFRKERPDVVHLHGWGSSSFDCAVGARLARVPVVVNGEHGMFFTKPFQIIFQRLAARFCDTVLSVSHSLKRETVAVLGIPSEKIRVIYNGVDTERFHGEYETAGFIDELKNTWGLSVEKSPFFVSLIGSVKHQKNQKMLITAVEKLNARWPDNPVRLLIVGDGPDRNALIEYVRNKGLSRQIVFPGKRDDVPVILSLTDVLTLTTIRGKEGLPNVILEAMASGVPVISTRSIGPDEVISDGINGYMIECDDDMALSNKLEELARDREMARRLGRQAREIIRAGFSLEMMVNGYETIYLEYLKEK